MATESEPTTEPRFRLSRDRVLRAAVNVADREGIEAVTMRRLADELGAEAMSLYYHVANKDAVLDGMVDIVIREINDVVGQVDVSSEGADWKKAIRQRILSARDVLLRHRWAPRLFETRMSVSPAVAQYFDAIIGDMRAGGFSYDLAHHALHALGSRALGFAQEMFDEGGETGDEESMAMLESMADRFPNLVGMIAEVAHDDPDSTLGWCDDQTEFEFGLDLILDGLDRMRAAG